MDIKPPFNAAHAKAAISALRIHKNLERAALVEAILRLETRNFTSWQYVQTGTAGMEAGKWKGLPKNLPFIEIDDKKKAGIEKFIVWNPFDFVFYLSDYIDRYNGNFARWNSTDQIKQASYKKAVLNQNVKFAVF